MLKIHHCVRNVTRTFNYYSRKFGRSMDETNYKTRCPAGLYRSKTSHLKPSINLAREIKNKDCTFIDLAKLIKDDKQMNLRFFANKLHDMKHIEQLTEEQVILLLEQCGDQVPNESSVTRNEICQQIFLKLKNANKLTDNILHKYITVCTQNKILLKYEELVSLLKNGPDKVTYKLLLENVCEKGDINQAFNILSEMRNRNIAVDEQTLNLLVLAQTIFGGIKDGETVMFTMRELQVPESAMTIFSLYKGLATRSNTEEFEYCIKKYRINFDSGQMIDLIETLALNNNTAWLNMILSLFPKQNLTEDFLQKLENLCIFLIHMKKHSAAVEIYMKMVKPSDGIRYGVSLFKEMLHSNTQVEKIIEFAKLFRDSGLNPHIFINITEIALKHKYFKSAWALFEHLPFLRPHFFWPLLLDAHYREEESGILKTLTKMMSLKVPIDAETLEIYCLPFCDLRNVSLTLNKLRKVGLTMRELVAAMTLVLLKKGEVKVAVELNNKYNVQLNGERLLQLLPHVWFHRKDITPHIVYFVQRVSESDSTGIDFVGEFLIKCLKLCETPDDIRKYTHLVKEITLKGLKVNSDSADLLYNFLSYKCQDRNSYEELTVAVENLMDFSMRADLSPVLHPKDMDTDQLECHLIELKSKGMGIRGAMRKLIQQHASLGYIRRVMELRKEFLASGYKESSGMKASIMHTFIKAGHTDAAVSIYKELCSQDKNFRLDSFKIIDLACLLVQEKHSLEAKSIIDEESKQRLIKGGPSIEKNCHKLLDACDNENDQLEIFNLLVERGFCRSTNKLLGPLVRLHLKKNDLDKAVKRFDECTRKYKCTPLQLELLCAALIADRQDLVEDIMNGTREVHGPRAVDEVLFMALAETKLNKPLQNFLAANTVTENRLEKVCDKWISEDKLDCFLTVIEAYKKVPSKSLNIAKIYQSVMKVYSNRKDCENAISFYEQLLEDEAMIDKETKEELNRLLEKSHYQIPNSLKNKF